MFNNSYVLTLLTRIDRERWREGEWGWLDCASKHDPPAVAVNGRGRLLSDRCSDE